ncbi:unnamed protein product, partial [Ectocarpus fasciculatus]
SPAVSRSSSAGLMPGVGPAATAVKGGAAGGEEPTPAFDPDRMHLGSFNSDEAFAEIGPTGAPASSSAAAAAAMGMGGAGAWSGGFDGGLSTTDVVVEWYEVMLGRLRCLDALGEHRKVLESSIALWKNLQDDWARVGVGRDPKGGFSTVATGARGPRAPKRSPLASLVPVSRPTTPKMLPPPALATKAAAAAAAAAAATTTTTTAVTTMTVPPTLLSTAANPSLASRSTDSIDVVGGAAAAPPSSALPAAATAA